MVRSEHFNEPRASFYLWSSEVIHPPGYEPRLRWLYPPSWEQRGRRISVCGSCPWEWEKQLRLFVCHRLGFNKGRKPHAVIDIFTRVPLGLPARPSGPTAYCLGIAMKLAWRIASCKVSGGLPSGWQFSVGGGKFSEISRHVRDGVSSWAGR